MLILLGTKERGLDGYDISVSGSAASPMKTTRRQRNRTIRQNQLRSNPTLLPSSTVLLRSGNLGDMFLYAQHS